MEFRRYGDTYYIRMDRGDEIISSLIDLCSKENISSCTYSGIGGCGSCRLQTFIPETGEFETSVLDGMLEMASLTGNIISDEEGRLYSHAHGVFAYKEDGRHKVAAGHLRSTVVLYTAEITLTPVPEAGIKRQFDPETGTGFWKFP